MIVRGIILEFGPIITGKHGNNREFSRRAVIVEVRDEDYTKKLHLTAWNKMQTELSKCAVGDYIEVECNVESRESNGRWFTDVKPWRFV